MDKQTELYLTQQSIIHCHDCDLRTETITPVSFRSKANPRVVVIGGGPSSRDLNTHTAWSDKTGRYTSMLLREVGIMPRDVAWMNVVCCGSGVEVKQSHIDACRLNARRQLTALSAPYSLVVGSVALGSLLNFRATLKELRGQWWKPGTGGWAMAINHPSATMHGYAPYQEAIIKNDLIKFARTVNNGDIYPPKLSEHCIRCFKWASHFVLGVAFCAEHAPHRLRKEKGFIQLDLLGEL